MRRMAILFLSACAGKARVTPPTLHAGPCGLCPGERPGTASLRIRVTISATSIPAWFASVRVGRIEGDVDANGEVLLNGVPSGEQEVVVADTEVYRLRIVDGLNDTLDATVPATIFLREPPPRVVADCDCGAPLPPGFSTQVTPCLSPPVTPVGPHGSLLVRLWDAERLEPMAMAWIFVGQLEVHTNERGEARLEGVPAGEQDVVIQHSDGWSAVRRVRILDGAEVELEVSLDHTDAAPLPPLPPPWGLPGPDGWICPYGRRDVSDRPPSP